MRINSQTPILFSVLTASLMLSGCSKDATGQVAAVVNGDEITLQEVNAELASVGVPDAAQKEKARAGIVQRLVDKRLLEQQAKAAGIDRDPEFLMRQRQLNQALVLEFYAKRAQDTIRVPDKATIDKFIADNPTNFAGRTIYTVEQIRFAPPEDPAIMNRMKDLHSLDAVTQFLDGQGVKYARATNKIDSVQVPAAMMKQVTSLPAGEPFVIPTPQGVVASVIVNKEAAPLPAEQAQPLAVQMMRNKALDGMMQQRLKDARSKAKIDYQSGFAPPAAPK